MYLRKCCSKILQQGIRVILAITLFIASTPVSSAFAQTDDAVERVIAKMTAAERVGQLFLVSFDGAASADNSIPFRLINEYHVGGVILSADRSNFTEESTTTHARELINDLQRQNAEIQTASRGENGLIVPLYIGISQEGGGFPNDQILTGLTRIPNQMSIGATWNTNLANQAGQTMGYELSALGFNLYYGLSLDVLTSDEPAANPELSTRTFGGDPYWVGELGRHYISGIKSGSSGKIAVFAKHFPGRGGSNRQADLEIPTIRKSLEQLQTYELLPYYRVMEPEIIPDNRLDGILVGHIRYQGFQGNIRATTKPISFDQNALAQLLDIAELKAWRDTGGLVVSDDLGALSVRQFFDPASQSFNPRLVARDAFLAGNDLLVLGDIRAGVNSDNFTSVTEILAFFTQRYQDDDNFAHLVDASLRRVLQHKYRLFGDFSPLQPLNPEPSLGTGELLTNDLNFSIARQSATLVSPTLAELSTVLPDPPSVLDYLVFITDVRVGQQCATCTQTQIMPKEYFQTMVNRLYGPLADGLVVPSHLSSFSVDELGDWLDGYSENLDLANALGRAEWIVLLVQDIPEGSTQLETLRKFLNEKQGLFANKKVILFSFGAPYYLDSTDISRLTAFYNMYDPGDAFITMAARLLFQELSPIGASPVSIPGTGYDLINVTAPSAHQVLSLRLFKENPLVVLPNAMDALANDESPNLPQPTTLPLPTAEPVFREGDTLYVQTGVIIDHNLHPVPDGTPVLFNLSTSDEFMQQVESVTIDGRATASFRLEKTGFLEITAASQSATTSEIIQLDVSNQGSTIIIVTPTPDFMQPDPAPTQQIDPAAIAESDISPFLVEKGTPKFAGWLLIILVIFAGMLLTYVVASQILDNIWALRLAILAVVGGLLVYNFIMFNGGAGLEKAQAIGLVAYIQPAVLGEVFGVATGVGWMLLADRRNKAEEK